jgi:hypothetical protein
VSPRPDKHIAARLNSARLHTKHERATETVVLKAMSEWLDAARYLLLREVRNTLPGLTAASYPPPMAAIDSVVASYNTWRQQTNANVLPAIGVAFGEAFQQVRRGAEYSSYRWEQAYLAEVSDRLKIWPEGAFEELRPELLEALSEAEDYRQITERVGRILNIDAATRAIRADINDVDNQLMDPDLDPARKPLLEARRRRLWEEHDESLGEWQWKARRIARTEIHGAILGGRLAAARAAEIATGDSLWKRWLSTDDSRVRLSHRVADGQVVKLAEPFRVGGYLLLFPGDPITIAPHETINCRCDLNFLDYDELQDELQGPDGSMGEIRPGGIRIGPDDPDDADAAIDALADETRRPRTPRARGEDHGQQLLARSDPVAVDPDHKPERPLPDLSGLTDEQLTQAMFDAEDDELYEYLAAEADRRADMFDDEPELDGDDTELDDEPLEDEYPVEQIEAWLAAEDEYTADVEDWLVAEQQYRAEVDQWLVAETKWKQDVAAWLTAEQAWIDDPLPALPHKDLTHYDLTDDLDSRLDFNNDIGRANPNYAHGTEWQVNCQRVVQALELRRRGYDVTAEPAHKGSPGFTATTYTYSDYLATGKLYNLDHYGRLWRERDGTVREFMSSGGKAATLKAIGKLSAGARGWISVIWKGGAGAHIFSWEVRMEKGVKVVRLVDGQTTDFDVISYLDDAERGSIKWMRVDDLMPTEDATSMVRVP